MQSVQSPPRRSLVIGALVAVQVLFGVNYVVSKVVVDQFPPLVWASVRIWIAAAVMMAVAVISRRPHPRDGRKFFVPLIGLALLGAIINQTSFLVGLRYTTSTNSAILNTLIPVFTLLLVTLRGQEQMTRRKFAGFGCALLGVLVIRHIEELNLSDNTWIGDLLTVINCLSYAFFLSYGKRFIEEHDRIWTTAWLFFYGAIGITLISIPSWSGFAMPELTHRMLGLMAFAIIGGTFFTYFLNIWALTYARSSSVALFIYIQPIVATLLAWGWMGQAPTLRTIAASVLIFVGMVLGLTSNKRT